MVRPGGGPRRRRVWRHNRRLLQPGAPAGGVTERVAGSGMGSLTGVAAREYAPAAEAPIRWAAPAHSRPPMLRSLTAIAVAACLLLQACGAGWRRPPDLELGPLAQRQQAQVWHQGRVVRWHALVISADSISGVPYLRPPDCDSCRVALPRAQVDSLRLGNPVAGFWKTVGLVVGIPLLVLGVVCVIGDGGPPCTGRS